MVLGYRDVMGLLASGSREGEDMAEKLEDDRLSKQSMDAGWL
jgi:hypothetical protein